MPERGFSAMWGDCEMRKGEDNLDVSFWVNYYIKHEFLI